MTGDFARLVLLAGHGSSTVNNPYATGLDCGACGGHTGEANARVAAGLEDEELGGGDGFACGHLASTSPICMRMPNEPMLSLYGLTRIGPPLFLISNVRTTPSPFFTPMAFASR